MSDTETPRPAAPCTSAPRQLIVLNDGTNNNLTGGTQDTHVVKLCELLRQYPEADRLIYYDAGVGNPGELPGATSVEKLRRKADRISGLAFGRGVFENVAQAYRFLMFNYVPGDEVFILGFSRGAFSARSVAGLVNTFGIAQPQFEPMIATLLYAYFSDRGDAKWQAIAAQARRLFAAQAAQRVELQFVGVWDTVASVGMPPFGLRITARPDLQHKNFLHVRQALALDELRAQFKPRLYAENNGPLVTATGRVGSVKQLWFRGAHGDIGGGYPPEESALADLPLAWLLSEAVQSAGLKLGALRSEADFLAAAQSLRGAAPVLELYDHGELHDSAWWALTGMAQRTTTQVELDEGAPIPVIPEEHPSVQTISDSGALHCVWHGTRPWRPLIVSALMIPVLMIWLGLLLNGFARSNAGWWSDALQAVLWWPDHLASNARFAWWQLQAIYPLVDDLAARQFASPRWAAAWDLALIVSYAYFLARCASWAFWRRTGLRRAGDKVDVWLTRLGKALPLMVIADVAEDVLTVLTITLARQDLPVLAGFSGFAMALASVAKFVGLAGVVALVLCGLRPRAAPECAPA